MGWFIIGSVGSRLVHSRFIYTSDFEEIMNKASCLSLVSNSILYWYLIKIEKIINQFERQGEEIKNEVLAHISLLP